MQDQCLPSLAESELPRLLQLQNREQLAAFKDEETRRWNIGNERDQKLFDLGMEDRATSEEIGGNIVKNAAEKQRSEKIREKYTTK